jgi:chromosomal replication initiator protein
LEPENSAVKPSSSRSLPDTQKLWQAALGELQLQMTRATFDTWLRGSQVVEGNEEGFTVYVRHAYAVDWLQHRLLPMIQRVVDRLAGTSQVLSFTTRAPDADIDLMLVPEAVPEDQSRGADGPAEAGNAGDGGARSARGGAVKARANGRPSSDLNPRYTFGTFIVGASNRLAHAACLAVAENPARAYNPLVVYSGVGLGKTHLLHAVGHVAQQQGLSVLYLSAEWFANDLINAIRNQTTDSFRVKYRNIDVLLVDDIQFIAGKERTQEEFFHTFNTLHGANKQIVISSDRPPKALMALEERLRSRFNWGLIADMQPPDLETRIAILRCKAESSGLEVPAAVLAFIARKIPSNVRELEGALNCVLAHAQLMHAPLTMETAQAALAGLVGIPTDLTPGQILTEVARHYRLDEGQLKGPSRAKAVCVPRQLAMYLIRQETGASLPEIGQLLGGRDHTTILHGFGRIEAQIEEDEALRRDWLAIKERLSDHASTNK